MMLNFWLENQKDRLKVSLLFTLVHNTEGFNCVCFCTRPDQIIYDQTIFIVGLWIILNKSSSRNGDDVG